MLGSRAIFESLGDEWGQGLVVQREQEDRSGAGYCLFGLGRLALDRGNVEEALALLEAGLDLFKQVGDRRYTAIVLTVLGRAPLVERAGHERNVVALRSRIAEAHAFDRAWHAGRARESVGAGVECIRAVPGAQLAPLM